ncbi:hypothetical protein TcCL_Unassigned01513 [Trypanosoma cruzi]|nr:hypothetical protein TcCL_Unassigned01513 [Trypanosoma cruzi]
MRPPPHPRSTLHSRTLSTPSPLRNGRGIWGSTGAGEVFVASTAPVFSLAVSIGGGTHTAEVVVAVGQEKTNGRSIPREGSRVKHPKQQERQQKEETGNRARPASTPKTQHSYRPRALTHPQ